MRNGKKWSICMAYDTSSKRQWCIYADVLSLTPWFNQQGTYSLTGNVLHNVSQEFWKLSWIQSSLLLWGIFKIPLKHTVSHSVTLATAFDSNANLKNGLYFLVLPLYVQIKQLLQERSVSLTGIKTLGILSDMQSVMWQWTDLTVFWNCDGVTSVQKF